ncbi:MAG: hypothetical protein AAB909_00330 [Patescibacteria group bacterium]
MTSMQAWNEIVKIQPRRVVTIPSKLAGDGFEEGNFVRVRKVDGRLIFEPVTMPRYSVRRYTDKEVDEFFALDDQQTIELRKKGVLK